VDGAVDALLKQSVHAAVVKETSELTMNAAEAADCPTMQAAPIDAQPPKLSNFPNTSEAGAFGAKTHKGIQMAKKPTTKAASMTPSNSGRCLAPNELKAIAKTPTAMVMSVYCLFQHFCQHRRNFMMKRKPYQTVGWYEGFCVDAMVRISEPAWYADEAMKACHPSAASQPEM
jgi:hypothetical protein